MTPFFKGNRVSSFDPFTEVKTCGAAACNLFDEVRLPAVLALTALAGLGVIQIVNNPQILSAVSPWYALAFLLHNKMHGFVDVSFFGANMAKIFHGAWFPLVIAGLVYSVMVTWEHGRKILAEKMKGLTQGLRTAMKEASFFLGREKLSIGDRPGMSNWRAHLFLFLSRNAMDAAGFFDIPLHQVIEVGAQLEV